MTLNEGGFGPSLNPGPSSLNDTGWSPSESAQDYDRLMDEELGRDLAEDRRDDLYAVGYPLSENYRWHEAGGW